MSAARPIQVIFFADRAVLLGLHAALGSLVGYLTDKGPVQITIYHEKLSPKDILRLHQTVRIAHSRGSRREAIPSLQVKPAFALPHDGLHPHTGSLLPYCKLFVPTVLAKEGRVCVLDCDILVEDDISILFDSPLEGKPIGCVIESILSNSLEKDFWAAQGRTWYGDYFNTGVLLFDLEGYWNANLLEITSRFLSEHRDACLQFDQTVFNAVLYPYIKPLETRWNKVVYSRFSSNESDPPGITHYLSNPKPFDVGGRMVNPSGRVFARSLWRWTGLKWWPLSTRFNGGRLRRSWKIRRSYLGVIRARLKKWLSRRINLMFKPV